MPLGARGTASRDRSELVDELMEAYLDWREECNDLRDAYDRWSLASPDERGLGFVAYSAALDREEQASAVYAERTQLVASELSFRRKPFRRLRSLVSA
jgi:hypothetical protein